MGAKSKRLVERPGLYILAWGGEVEMKSRHRLTQIYTEKKDLVQK